MMRKPMVRLACGLALILWTATSASASTAYGDLNNFDVFNDTGQDCHGFEIELDDVHSTDITYTYDWNHYGAPTITEDNSDPNHPKVFVRYAAKYSGSAFNAYTAVPASPPSPTDGHMCTNPAVNIGCEHFGVGYYGTPTLVRYNWLLEDPLAPGTLKLGPTVNVATPSWTYYPPAPAQPVAQVQAVVLAPPPPPAPVYEFGDAVWVKAIVTTSHNNGVVELKDLISDDPDDANDVNWRNGEPDEVEVEWQVLQTEFNNPAGANNDLAGAPEDLPHGDEVVTRRYEFYKYTGPFDTESNEAKCTRYPQVSDPNNPKYKPECDPAAATIVGDYIGAQMAGFNVEAVLGLIDHVQDGDLNSPYTPRTVVVGGNTPYDAAITAGALPPDMALDPATGVLSGTPAAAGLYSFTVTATDADLVQVSKAYTLHVTGAGGLCDGVICGPLDGCHDIGVCDPDTGLCSNPVIADGTLCDDSDACTQTDTCQAGVCTGSDPITCSASDDCHVAGECDPATGICSDPAAPDGTLCDEGDGCPADTCAAGVCQAVSCPGVDVVVLPLKPLTVKIDAGQAAAVVTTKVSLRNADSVDRSLVLTAEDGDCPAGLAGTVTPAQITVAAGKAASVTLQLTVRATDFDSANAKAPPRCTLLLTAAADVVGGSNEPNLSNNTAPLELNVVDGNDSPATPPALHETMVKSVKPLGLRIKPGDGSVSKTLKAKVVNGDSRPVAEKPGDAITLTATSSCAGLTLGTPVCDRETSANVITVKGGGSKTCKVEATAAAGGIDTANPLSPQRCIVTLKASGPSDPETAPLDAANNTTQLVIDLIDDND